MNADDLFDSDVDSTFPGCMDKMPWMYDTRIVRYQHFESILKTFFRRGQSLVLHQNMHRLLVISFFFSDMRAAGVRG